MPKIYCAGPLFNRPEREEMKAIAATLEDSKYEVFLPQRDGIELAKLNEVLIEQGYAKDMASKILSVAIFYIDVYHVIDSDGMILNLNGRVPDEGAMVEAGIAWAYRKPVLIYKNDSRSAFAGIDNPLVLGLSTFEVIDRIELLPTAFNKLFLKIGEDKNNIIKNRDFTFRFGKYLFNYYNQLKRENFNIDISKSIWTKILGGKPEWETLIQGAMNVKNNYAGTLGQAKAKTP